MRRLLQRSQRLIIWLGVLPALMAVVAYWTSQRHIESVSSTIETGRFLRTLDDLLSSVKDAETGQRGYLLTSDPEYLDPFQSAKARLPGQISAVMSLGRASEADQRLLNRIPELVRRKIAELDITLALHKTSPAAAVAHVKTDVGRELMTQLRDVVAAIRTQQQQKLGVFEARQTRRQEALDTVLSAGVVVSLILVYMAYTLSVRYGRERDQIEHEIRDLVAERTAALQARTRELEASAAELQRSNNDLLQFAYVSSHDLQEPLRTVASYVGLLKRRLNSQLDETSQKYIQFAVDGANRMQTLINDLLSYSRVGTQGIQSAPVNMNKVVKAALQNLDAAILNSGARVTYSNLPAVLGDENKLVQVVQNLIGNAIKFHKPGEFPEISIAAEPSGGTEWVFSIRDNGIGFDAKYNDRIFQVFQRLHGIGKYPGNGIGLAICRRIVEHHGGRLWATSEPEKGSTFFFALPASEQAAHLEPAVSGGAKHG